MIDVNLWAVLACGIVSMGIGMLWYGPIIFGKRYMKLMGVDMNDTKKIKESQKDMGILYFLQFVLTLLQVYVLAHVAVMSEAYFHVGAVQSSLTSAFWLWLGFIVPIQAGAAMWTNKSNDDKWAMFYISASYQLFSMLVFALILGYWA